MHGPQVHVIASFIFMTICNHRVRRPRPSNSFNHLKVVHYVYKMKAAEDLEWEAKLR